LHLTLRTVPRQPEFLRANQGSRVHLEVGIYTLRRIWFRLSIRGVT
jgi:hypothetical protein